MQISWGCWGGATPILHTSTCGPLPGHFWIGVFCCKQLLVLLHFNHTLLTYLPPPQILFENRKIETLSTNVCCQVMALIFGLPWAIQSLELQIQEEQGEVWGGVMHQNGEYLLVEWTPRVRGLERWNDVWRLFEINVEAWWEVWNRYHGSAPEFVICPGGVNDDRGTLAMRGRVRPRQEIVNARLKKVGYHDSAISSQFIFAPNIVWCSHYTFATAPRLQSFVSSWIITSRFRFGVVVTPLN